MVYNLFLFKNILKNERNEAFCSESSAHGPVCISYCFHCFCRIEQQTRTNNVNEKARDIFALYFFRLFYTQINNKFSF